MVARGDVWWADFGEPKGSTPALRRPAVVVSANWLNKTRLATLIVVPLTAQARRAAQPGTIPVPENVAGLNRFSVAIAHQVTTINRADLDERIGTLPSHLLGQVDQALRSTLHL